MNTATVYDNECTITRDGMGVPDRFASTDAMASYLKAIAVANEVKTIDDTAMVTYSREPGVSEYSHVGGILVLPTGSHSQKIRKSIAVQVFSRQYLPDKNQIPERSASAAQEGCSCPPSLCHPCPQPLLPFFAWSTAAARRPFEMCLVAPAPTLVQRYP